MIAAEDRNRVWATCCMGSYHHARGSGSLRYFLVDVQVRLVEHGGDVESFLAADAREVGLPGDPQGNE